MLIEPSIITSIVPDGSNNKSKPANVIFAKLLRLAGFVLIALFFLILGVLVLGPLIITVNPDTGERVNGPEAIMPIILNNKWSFLLLILGIICLFASRKVRKKDKNTKSEAKILTMEEVKDDTYTNTGSRTEELDKDQTDDNKNNL